LWDINFVCKALRNMFGHGINKEIFLRAHL
jgi:hypothetical protein